MAITESDIRKLAEAKSYRRGKEYFESDAVMDLEKRGNTIFAEVEGSDYDSYEVKVKIDGEKIASTSCTCPYDWGGICKHIVAVLLNYINKPESIDEQPTFSELLANLKESELREILVDLLESEPGLLDHIKIKLAALSIARNETQTVPETQPIPVMHSTPDSQQTSSIHALKQSKPIDISSFKRQAKQIFKDARRGSYYDDYYDDEEDSGIGDAFEELFNQAKPFIDSCDFNNALLILDTVMDVFADSWSEEEYYDDISSITDGVSSLFAEAFLSLELSAEEKKKWKKKLLKWQKKLSGYTSSDGFDLSVTALEQGWDYPPLKAVLDGQSTETGAWELDEDGEYPEYAYDLNIIRLRILERQGRSQEYLYFAEAEGLTEYYLTMLVKLDRSREAVEYALEYGLVPSQAMMFCSVLNDNGLIEDALKIAELTLVSTVQKENIDYVKDRNFLLLAQWLRDNAQKHSDIESAIKGAKFAFKSSFDLKDYVATESIAQTNGEWEKLKLELLAELKNDQPNRHFFSEYNKVEIYLHEKMHRQVLEVIDKSSDWWNYAIIEKVVDAVYKEFPDWAIKQCKQQAEPNMDDGKSKYYIYSVRWVEKAGKAYIAAGRRKEWNEYLEGLIKKHQKKYSLRP
ncbi:MAG: SWIM zinc finger family protein, partial [Desulfamplus sp.]|nr:SWIM zinc finger family protein [Desulfamplus sp.]